MKKFLLFFAFLSVFFSAQKKNELSVIYTTFYGKSVGNFTGDVSNHTESYKLGISKKLNPEDAEWIRLLNAENVSLSFVYTDLDGIVWMFPYGKSFGLLSEADFRILKTGNFKMFISPGFGISYVTETAFTNNQFIIFGSHLNAVFTGALKGEYQFQKDMSLLASLSYLHYSNGSMRIPNAGVNIMNIGFGIKKDFDLNDKEHQVKSEIPLKNNAFEFTAGIGKRGKYRSKDSVFRMGFYAGYSKFLNNAIGLRAGLDGSYYGEVYNPDNYEDTQAYLANSSEHFRAGASLGLEVKMNKIGVTGNYGRYIYFKNPNNRKSYWNASIKYYFTPKFGIQGMLNAHKFQADFVNWGLFIRI